MVPKDVSPTQSIGHSHEVHLQGDELTVIVWYLRTGKKKTTTLSVAALFQQFVKNRSVIEFKYGEVMWTNGSVNPLTGTAGQVKRPGCCGERVP